MKRPLIVSLFIASLFLFAWVISPFAEEITTKYTIINYPDEATLNNFLWKTTMQDVVSIETLNKARERIDAIVEKVQFMLGMPVDSFKVTIKVNPLYREGNIATYFPAIEVILLSADRITYGVFAHEIARAVIESYISVNKTISSEAKEILCQYVM